LRPTRAAVDGLGSALDWDRGNEHLTYRCTEVEAVRGGGGVTAQSLIEDRGCPRRSLGTWPSSLSLAASPQHRDHASAPSELIRPSPARLVPLQAAFPYQRDHLPRPRSAHALPPLSRRAILPSRTSNSTICRLKSSPVRHRGQRTMTLNNIGVGTRMRAGRQAAVEEAEAGVRSGIRLWMLTGPTGRRGASVSPVRARGFI
jgi:hypothetical protein